MVIKIFLDPGHGGRDPGSVRNNGVVLLEKDLNLEICWHCRDVLQEHGFEVTMSRIDDSTMSLPDRVTYANTVEMDAFLSVHCNSAPRPDAEGIETHVWRDTSVSEPFGRAVHETLRARFPEHVDRGIRRSGLYVLRRTWMIAALVECEFLSNLAQARFLCESAGSIGEAIAQGVINYYSSAGETEESA